MSRKNIFIIIAAIVFISIGIWLGTIFNGSPSKNSPYSAVYLTTGDIYFGKLSWFPKPHIENAWRLDQAADKDNKPQPTLVPIKAAFWGPSEDVYLNKEQIIFWTRLRADSAVAKAMDNPQSASAANEPESPSTTNTNP